MATLRPQADHVACTLRLGDLRDLASAVNRVRRLLDLDADPVAVADVLGADPALTDSVRAHPGIRVPGCVDGDEIVVRAVLGQQVSVQAARTAARRLTEHLGERLATPDDHVTTLFPSAEALAGGAGALLTGPRRRIETVVAVTTALADGTLRVDPGRDEHELRGELEAMPGIGPWTANYVIIRVLGTPDVLLDGDLVLRKGAAALGLPGSPAALRAHSRRWSPWRAYAGMHCWRAASPSSSSRSEAS